jgi:hypothetical protein
MAFVFRHLFGLYLIWHFSGLIFYAEEVFGLEGMIKDPSLIPTYEFFPNILTNSKIDPTLFLIILTVISILFTLGICHNWMALILYYGWACLLNRNVFIMNPGVPYIGWLLIAHFFIQPNSKAPINLQLRECMWFLILLGYTVSGLHKLQSPSWVDGSALRFILESPLARDNILVHTLLQTPPIVLQIHTWCALALEISALPLGFFLYTRKLIWVLLFVMNVGVLFMINFLDLTMGILLVQLFTIF